MTTALPIVPAGEYYDEHSFVLAIASPITISIPFIAPPSYRGYACYIDWGDGTTTYLTTYNGAGRTHTYTGTGPFTVQIKGSFEAIYAINDTTFKDNVTSITKWGNKPYSAIRFNRCTNLTTVSATDVPNLKIANSLLELFDRCPLITSVSNVANWDVSNIINFTQTFFDTPSFIGAGLNGWDVSSGTNFSYMFGASAITEALTWTLGSSIGVGASFMFSFCTGNPDISGLDIQYVTTANHMFYGAQNFNRDISGFNFSNVTGSLESMFLGCHVFNCGGGPMGNWDVSGITGMYYMFSDAYVFNIDISAWDVSNVTVFQNMFRRQSGSSMAFNQPLAAWGTRTGSATTVSGMFYGCNNFNQDIGSWNLTSCSDMSSFLQNCTVFDQNVGGWQLRIAGVNMSNCLSGTGLSIANYNASLVGWLNYVNTNGGPTGVSIGVSGLVHDSSSGGNDGTAARATLIGTHGWTFSGDSP